MNIHRGKQAISFLAGNSSADEANVICPHCGSEYTHVRHVGTLFGSDHAEAELAHDGTATSGVTSQRRSAVEIVFSCENCPDLFALVIQQHKGNNFVEVHEDVPIRAE